LLDFAPLTVSVAARISVVATLRQDLSASSIDPGASGAPLTHGNCRKAFVSLILLVTLSEDEEAIEEGKAVGYSIAGVENRDICSVKWSLDEAWSSDPRDRYDIKDQC
jgi:hypothetical protein